MLLDTKMRGICVNKGAFYTWMNGIDIKAGRFDINTPVLCIKSTVFIHKRTGLVSKSLLLILNRGI